ncbi:CGNR zinc finger domain-containing protein [Pseudonocardia sp. CA-107938]|uniref:CGNR zinc finger domain-containing protein n=1 Tax=Pseudonocardia sp. CA-107938 TaxID=3240021 RepID=UPI003D94F8F8
MSEIWRGYEFIGGHVVLDLVNTLSWRRDQARLRDRLTDDGFRAEWLERVGLAPDSSLADLASLREILFRVLTEPEPARADLAGLQRWVLTAQRRARIATAVPLRWELDPSAPAVLVLALAAEELLRSPEAARIRECEGTGCGWLFLDSSRNRSRRWCSSGDCGNRERVRRHAQRQRVIRSG